MTAFWTLLAQATPTTGPTTRPAPPGGFLLTQLLPILLMVGVFYWIMSRGGRKERQRHQQMLTALKRNDKVLTIGGVLGTVVDVRDNEVVLKVDETSNVKMRFTRGAIKEVLAEAFPSEEKK